jgi:hypothetical protein
VGDLHELSRSAGLGQRLTESATSYYVFTIEFRSHNEIVSYISSHSKDFGAFNSMYMPS